MEAVVRPIERGDRRGLPILAGFSRELLPTLAVLWAGLVVAYLASGRDYLWTLLPWATVSLIMLWPVGRRVGRPYLSYRTPLFILGVLSMAYIPFVGFMLGTDVPYVAKLVLFILLPVDLTVFAIIPSLRQAIGEPLPMIFRPDLIFGDGRVLCCGTIAFVLGLRYFVGHPPPPGVPVPIPVWNWYAIFLAIVLGFIPLIALRGLVKVVMRLRRMRDGAARGWGAIVLRELWLVITVLALGFAFHNVFKGWAPFVTSHTVLHEWSWVPALTLLGGAGLLVFVRGGFKKRVGDPFIRERIWQSFVKQLLLVAGLVVMMWSLMSILDTEIEDVRHAGYRPIAGAIQVEATTPGATMPGAEEMPEVHRLPSSGFILPGIKGVNVGPWNWVGVGFLAWGLVVLVPFRVLAQHYQRHALVAQMAAVLIPAQRPADRRRLVRGMLQGLLDLPFEQRRAYLLTMNRALADADPEARRATTRAVVAELAGLSDPEREAVVSAQVACLQELSDERRRVRMTDMMAAVSELPEEGRRAVMATMASHMG
ncbi:MAG TPA: hypothetical protein VNO79_14215 [Actinomycetota bacterium]|nr:hypothetical protein [Actinomycetota bacterium]